MNLPAKVRLVGRGQAQALCFQPPPCWRAMSNAGGPFPPRPLPNHGDSQVWRLDSQYYAVGVVCGTGKQSGNVHHHKPILQRLIGPVLGWKRHSRCMRCYLTEAHVHHPPALVCLPAY